MTAAIEVEELEVSYRRGTRRLSALSGVSLRIERGEAYGLVGESGSGKSTLALALLRYLPRAGRVDSGRILLGGDDVLAAGERTLREWRGRRIALVAQSVGGALNPSLQVGTQMREVFAAHAGLLPAEAAEAAARMLSQVRVADPARMLSRYPHELSAGQQQRVLIAMALATDPEVLVLDEPTTALDATVEAEVLDLLESLRAATGTAILLVSHDLRVVAHVCDRAGVLYAGRLVEEGPADEVIGTPRHPYTLALLRCLPRVDAAGAPALLEPLPGTPPPLGRAVSGCVFVDRCPLARERCRAEPPPAYAVADGRTSRCHYHDEVPAAALDTEPAAAPTRRDANSAAAPLLRVDGLWKTHRRGGTRVEAVAGASFEVGRGEIFGLVGESGSGKTTLARCLVGLAQPTAGSVELDGEPLAGALRGRSRDARRAVQLVFQNADGALNRSLSIGTTLTRSLRRLAERNGNGAAADLASLVRIPPAELALRPAALSGGMKQRIAIARALAGSPSLVVCDEPVSDLDVSVQAAIVNLFREIRERDGISFVFISHDLAVVRYVADRVGVMYLGWLVEVGPAELVFEPPHHPYTEALVSSAPPLALGEPRPRIPLHGPLPSASRPPGGCRFHTRCPRYLGELCATEEPPWREDAAGHRYRCHIEPGELAAAQRADRLAGRPPTRAAGGDRGD